MCYAHFWGMCYVHIGVCAMLSLGYVLCSFFGMCYAHFVVCVMLILGYVLCSFWGICYAHFGVCVMLIFEDSTENMKCKTTIIALFLHLNLRLCVTFDSLLCIFTSTSILTNKIKITLKTLFMRIFYLILYLFH